MKTYRIQLTGILNDKWLTGQTFGDRKEAQKIARYLMTETDLFDTGHRASFKSAQVVESRWAPAEWQTKPENVTTDKVQLWAWNGGMITAQLSNKDAREMIQNGSCFVITEQAIGWLK